MASQQPNNRRPEGLAPGAHVTAPVLHAIIRPHRGPSDVWALPVHCVLLTAASCFQLLVFLQVLCSLAQGSHCSSLLLLAALAGASRHLGQEGLPLQGQVMHSRMQFSSK